MSTNLSSWFSERPIWLQEAANRLQKKAELSDNDIKELFQLCHTEASGKAKKSSFSFTSDIFTENITGSLRLCSIGDIKGINQLAPRKPLEFGDNNLVVVFGSNGSGKSGYVRILKHACGARCPGTLHSNIFTEDAAEQTCTIAYSESGDEQACTWNATSGIIDQLRQLDIFDASCGLVYVTDENEVTYEPAILSFFSDLVKICDQLATQYRSSIQSLVSKLPVLPPEYTNTNPGKWYLEISKDTTDKDIENQCCWKQDDGKKLLGLQQRLAEESPTTKAQKLRTQKRHLDSLVTQLETHISRLSDKACKDIISLNLQSNTKKKAADTAAKALFKSAPLSGIGSDVWAELWNKAKEYSESLAYVDQEFPVIDDDARCVLCQQILSDEAKRRFISFEEFIKGEMRKDADTARQQVDVAIDELSDIPTIASLKTTMDAAGLDEEDAKNIETAISDLQKRKEQLQNSSLIENLTALPNVDNWIKSARKESKSLETAAGIYDEDAKGENRTELTNEKKELDAQKWVSEQKDAIKEEIERLLEIEALESAISLCDTKALSYKKGRLAEFLITDEFAKRFSSELGKLRAGQVKMKVVKTRVRKGHALHCLRWQDGEEGPVEEILSEGENRIVSLSAFLADVAEKKNPGPFVFDDPISSLDQDFEEAVAARLVALSADRQVIVFTHRLSLLSLLQDYGKKVDQEPHVVCIKRENWGAGEPGAVPIFAKRPHSALNDLINSRLAQAQKVLINEGKDAYYPLAKAICSDFRIIIERIIENDLMADVVQRFRRPINTQGKLVKLAKIKSEDCTYLDELMTKYSYYEHSQPDETPINMPGPDDLKSDMESLKQWRDEFDKRDML